MQSLKSAPCSITLKSKCHFVSDAKDAIDANKMVEIELNQLRLVQKTTSKKIQDTNPSKVAEYIKNITWC